MIDTNAMRRYAEQLSGEGRSHIANEMDSAVDEIESLRASLARHVALLRSMEWASQESCRNYVEKNGEWGGGGYCPCCNGMQTYDASPGFNGSEMMGGHKTDCALAALLDA